MGNFAQKLAEKFAKLKAKRDKILAKRREAMRRVAPVAETEPQEQSGQNCGNRGETALAAVATLLLVGSMVALASLASGCCWMASPSHADLRERIWDGDKALWRHNKEQNERILTLERRIYHLERGELLDWPLRRVVDNPASATEIYSPKQTN